MSKRKNTTDEQMCDAATFALMRALRQRRPAMAQEIEAEFTAADRAAVAAAELRHVRRMEDPGQ